MSLLLLFLIILLLFGGVGCYGYPGGIGVGGVIIIVLIVWLLLGR